MKRIIIISGASSGIGKEFALQLAQSNSVDEIWLLARREELLKETASEILKVSQVNVKTLAIDLAGKAGVLNFKSFMKQFHDSKEKVVIDTLVNNAGFGTYGPFTETPIDRQLDMIDLNVYTLTALCAECIPFMGKGSNIINIASLASFIPLGNFAVYAATKAYVLSFSVALAAELTDKGIFVSSVCPGPVDTEFALVASHGARKKVVDGKSPQAVVKHCLKDIDKNKKISIMALKWKLKAFFSRFVGRYFFARYTFLYEKRPSDFS